MLLLDLAKLTDTARTSRYFELVQSVLQSVNSVTIGFIRNCTKDQAGAKQISLLRGSQFYKIEGHQETERLRTVRLARSAP